MKVFKRIFAFLLAVGLLASLAACTEKTPENSSKPSNGGTQNGGSIQLPEDEF